MSEKKKTNAYFGSRGNPNRRDKKSFRIFLSIFIFTGVSLGFCFLRFHMPFAPDFIKFDISVFFELLAAIAYGPLIGGIICLLNFALHIVIVPEAFMSDLANFFVEETFILIASVYYYRTDARKKDKDGKTRRYRRKRIIIGSLLGIIPVPVIQFIGNKNHVFPWLSKHYAQYGYSEAEIIQKYASSIEEISRHLPKALASALPNITEMWQGILFFNVPTTFLKLLVISFITALIYPHISPYLHFRKKAK